MERHSKQRDEILEILKNSYVHPTAEEIYQELKKRNSTASQGTVYRNLLFLTDKGEIMKISMPNGSDRYDYIRDKHHHIVCTECEKVFDFSYEFETEHLTESVLEQTGVKMTSDRILIYGVCEKCNNKKY